jgi:hypothetical protein
VKYHIEEVQVPRGAADALDLGDGRRIVHVVSQVPAEDAGGLDTLHVLVEDDGTGADPRGYDGSGPGANMGAPQPAGPISDEDAELAERADGDGEAQETGEPEYPASPAPGEDAAPVEPEDPQAEADPAWTSESSDYEPGFERTDPEPEGEQGEGDAEGNRPADPDCADTSQDAAGDEDARDGGQPAVSTDPARSRERGFGWRGRDRNRDTRDE